MWQMLAVTSYERFCRDLREILDMRTKAFCFLFCFFSFTSLFCWHEEFIKSFATYYELNGAGRYTHEYHPFLLEKTAKSLDGLEDQLSDSGFDLHGRMVIAGYEEQAVQPLYTNLLDFKGNKIFDEARIHNKSGWSMRLHNRFGLMTGYVWQDCNKVEESFSWRDPIFEHIHGDQVEIFDSFATIYQKLILRGTRVFACPQFVHLKS